MANGDATVDAAEAGTISTPRSLRRRLLNAQKEVAKLEQDVTVEKVKTPDGKTFGGYKGISAAQVVAFGKAVLVKNGILYTPEIDPKATKRDGNKTVLWVNGIFENVDDPTDTMIRGFPGEGTDKADQGASKAFTNANKQILAKVLQMSTVDVKEDEPVDYEPDASRAIKQEAMQDKHQTLQAWGKSFKSALNNAKTVKEVDELQKANKQTLMSDDTPDVTREFFVDLIQERKALLGGE